MPRTREVFDMWWVECKTTTAPALETFSEKCEAASRGERRDSGGAALNSDQGQGACQARHQDQGVQRAPGWACPCQGSAAFIQPRDGAALLLQPLQPARAGQLHASTSQVGSKECYG